MMITKKEKKKEKIRTRIRARVRVESSKIKLKENNNNNKMERNQIKVTKVKIKDRINIKNHNHHFINLLQIRLIFYLLKSKLLNKKKLQITSKNKMKPFLNQRSKKPKRIYPKIKKLFLKKISRKQRNLMMTEKKKKN